MRRYRQHAEQPAIDALVLGLAKAEHETLTAERGASPTWPTADGRYLDEAGKEIRDNRATCEEPGGCALYAKSGADRCALHAPPPAEPAKRRAPKATAPARARAKKAPAKRKTKRSKKA